MSAHILCSRHLVFIQDPDHFLHYYRYTRRFEYDCFDDAEAYLVSISTGPVVSRVAVVLLYVVWLYETNIKSHTRDFIYDVLSNSAVPSFELGRLIKRGIPSPLQVVPTHLLSSLILRYLTKEAGLSNFGNISNIKIHMTRCT